MLIAAADVTLGDSREPGLHNESMRRKFENATAVMRLTGIATPICSDAETAAHDARQETVAIAVADVGEPPSRRTTSNS